MGREEFRDCKERPDEKMFRIYQVRLSFAGKKSSKITFYESQILY